MKRLFTAPFIYSVSNLYNDSDMKHYFCLENKETEDQGLRIKPMTN